MELDRVPLWRGDHLLLRQVAEDFARYLYLPRLRSSSVLVNAVADGIGLIIWESEAFAYADSFDEATRTYRGLRCGEQIRLSGSDLSGVLVKPEAARAQRDAQAPPRPPGGTPGPDAEPQGSSDDAGPVASPVPPKATAPTRFHGAVKLDPTRLGRDASRVADEVVAHLAGLVGTEVTVTLEIDAKIPSGAPDNVVRTVTGNSRTLKFTTQGFEKS